jgi:hypothetical protein
MCNGGMAAIFALQYMFHVGCKEVVIDFSHQYSQSWLAMSVLGALACSCGDTFSSELGSVFSRNTEPRLITTFQKVPRGESKNDSLQVYGKRRLNGVEKPLALCHSRCGTIDSSMLKGPERRACRHNTLAMVTSPYN